MHIKNFKMFIESTNNDLYLDADFIFQSYFISFYDEGYEFKMKKGWVDDKGQFRVLSPGNNRKLAYKISLINTEKSKIDLNDKLIQAQEIFEYDGFKLNILDNDSGDIEMLLISSDIKDISVEQVCKEINIPLEKYKKGEEFLRNQIENSTNKIVGNDKEWYNDKGEWIIQQNLKNDKFYLQYNRIWLFLESNLNLAYDDVQLLTTILLESILKCRVEKTIMFKKKND